MSRRLLPLLLLAACSGDAKPPHDPLLDSGSPATGADAGMLGPDGSSDTGTGNDAGGAGDGGSSDIGTGNDAGGAGDGGLADAGDHDGGTVDGDGGTADGDGGTSDRGPFPFRTRGRYIVDAYGNRVKLAAVNWYGASDVKLVVGGLDVAPIEEIVKAIKRLGFNAVRLPFANLMLHEQTFDHAMVAANPELVGLTPLQVYDRAVEALTDAGLYVILNNHTTHPMWCCNFDSDGLWYTSDYGEDRWLDDWAMMAARYRDNPRVIGADLRNEVRPGNMSSTFIPIPANPTWNGATNDWRVAAEKAGARVLEQNPDMLVIVEGINFNIGAPRIHLQGVRADPIRLPLPNRLVYAAHNYGYIGPDELSGPKYGDMNWDTFRDQMEKEWGYVVQENKAWTAPVWVSEFGDSRGDTASMWWQNLMRYLDEGDFDFAYWALNPGPKPSLDGMGEDEPYGLLERDWVTPIDDYRMRSIKELIAPKRGPGVEPGWYDDPAHHLTVLSFADWDTHATEPAVDWQSNAFKATCAEDARALGMSAIHRASQRLGHNLLCSSYAQPTTTGVRTLVANGGGDSENANAHTNGVDWAVGVTKLACPVGSMVVGASQARTVLVYRIEGILCEEANLPPPSECHTVDFWGGDGRRSELGGDWDPGGLKGQCADTEYVAGVGLTSGTPRSLLCCTL